MNEPSAAASRGPQSVPLTARTLFVTNVAVQCFFRDARSIIGIVGLGITNLFAGVFDGPSRDYSARLNDATTHAANVVRTLHVEERAGERRDGDLVRVPVFFAAGECSDLAALSIVDASRANGPEIPFQADDIRRAPDGGVSAAHLWFRADDFGPGERRRFHLVRRGGSVSRQAPPQPREYSSSGDNPGFETDRGKVVFGPLGELVSLSFEGHTWNFGENGAAPRVNVKGQGSGDVAGEVTFDHRSAKRTVEWSRGPLFGKVRVRYESDGGSKLEQVFRIPRHGNEIVLTSTIFPGEGSPVVRENQLLTIPGRALGNGLDVIRVPAGIRSALRAEHAYDVTALRRAKENDALLAVPLVVGGPNGRWTISKNGTVALQGQNNLQRGKEGEKGSLYGFWTEVRLIPVSGDTSVEALWRTYRRHVQPLVAIVEEPGVTTEQLHASLREIVREMKPIGWRQEAGRAAVLGDEARAKKIMTQAPAANEADVDSLLRGAENARTKITENGERAVKEHEKGRAYGRLDPYHITYTQSAAAALAVLREAPEKVLAVNLAMARGVRQAGGKTDAAGNPYIDCFNRTLNMQMGPVLLGITAGKAAGDTDLVRFYRDLATSPPVLGVFGRGQRPYTGASAKKADQTDYLYQAICDFWLRATELLADEDLMLHPLAYSRFTDCIDVLADQYHGVAAQHKDELPGLARANFFRGQAHTHRWLGWSASPYIRLLETPDEDSRAGLTEAIRHTQSLKGRWKNWPDLTFYILTDLLVREGLPRYRAPALLAPPTNVVVEPREGAGVKVAWEPRQEAHSYRIYRSNTPGGPYVWLNSPHRKDAGEPLVSEAHYDDTDGSAEHHYVVTAVDAAGREGPWPESSSPTGK